MCDSQQSVHFVQTNDLKSTILKEWEKNPQKMFFIFEILMRKIEREMNFAVSNKANWKKSNTEVCYNDSSNCSSIYLHGHQIATVDHNTNAVKLSSCGYETVTTKSRLNALLSEVKYGAKVYQKNWDWFVSFNNQVQTFFDNMILLDTDDLQVV